MGYTLIIFRPPEEEKPRGISILSRGPRSTRSGHWFATFWLDYRVISLPISFYRISLIIHVKQREFDWSVVEVAIVFTQE